MHLATKPALCIGYYQNRESGNRGIGEYGTVRGIGIPSVVSSKTTKYKSIPKKSKNPPWDLARILSQKCTS